MVDQAGNRVNDEEHMPFFDQALFLQHPEDDILLQEMILLNGFDPTIHQPKCCQPHDDKPKLLEDEDSDDEDYVYEEGGDDDNEAMDESVPPLHWRDLPYFCPCYFPWYCLALRRNHPAALPTLDLQNDWCRDDHETAQYFTEPYLGDALATMPALENLLLPISIADLQGPGWTQAVTFIQNSKTLKMLSLKYVDRPKPNHSVPYRMRAVVDNMLTAACQNAGMKELRLWSVSFHPSLLARMLREDRLTHLEIGKCYFPQSDKASLVELVTAFAVNKSLTSLTLVCAGWEHSVLAEVRNHSRIETLVVSISTRRAAQMLRLFLEKSPTLKQLHLYDCYIERAMARDVVKGLQTSRSVTAVKMTRITWGQTTLRSGAQTKYLGNTRRIMLRALVAKSELRHLDLDVGTGSISATHRGCVAFVDWRRRCLDLLKQQEATHADLQYCRGLVYPSLFAKLSSLATYDGYAIGPTVLFNMLRAEPRLITRTQNRRIAKRRWTGVAERETKRRR